MSKADYQLRHGMFGKTGSMWSRQVDNATRSKARAITEVAGCAGLLREVDTLAQYASGGGRVLVDDAYFRFVDGNFAVLGRDQSDYTHVSVSAPDGSTSDLALRPATPAVNVAPVPTAIAALDATFVAAIADAASHLAAGSDWYLIPIPRNVIPIVIEDKVGDMLVAGIDFTAHPGYIATRLSPADTLPSGLVRIVSAYVDLPQPHSFVLSAPVGRRCSKYLMEYVRKTQSLKAFRRAAAEYCGMFVFPEHDVILGKLVIDTAVDGYVGPSGGAYVSPLGNDYLPPGVTTTPRSTIYTTASAGAIRIDYPHIPLPLGAAVTAGTVVAPRLELLTESASLPVSVISRALDAEAVVSLDGILPVKGLTAPDKVLMDYVEIDPVSEKPHVRMHLGGSQPAREALWAQQKRHELATGEFLYDQFFPDGGSSRLLSFGDIVASYYGTQLTLLLYADLSSEMEELLLRFVREHKPTGCVMLTAT